MKKRGVQIYDYDPEDVVRMRLNGMSINTIAAALGITKAAVANVVRRRGLSGQRRAEPKSPTSIDSGKIGALRRAGWSVKDIAGDMRLSEEQVRQVVKCQEVSRGQN